MYASEKAMAPHSSTLAWKILWMKEPGGLQSMGSRRVGHHWATSLSLFTFMHWRRKWQPTPVFLPGESQGLGSLVGCRLWDRTVEHDWSDLAAVAARMHAKSLQLCPTVCNNMDCKPPRLLSMGFSRLKYWSELPCPTPRQEVIFPYTQIWPYQLFKHLNTPILMG